MKIEDATFVVVDTETDGLGEGDEKPAVIEVAAVATSIHRANLGMFHSLAYPARPIPPEVSAVHGRTNEDLRFAPEWEEVEDDLARFIDRFALLSVDADPETPVLAAHNAEYDAPLLHLPGYQWLCSQRLAMHFWPDAPNFKLGTLRFWRNLPATAFGNAAHWALPDTMNATLLLRAQLFEALERGFETVEQLIELADSPARLVRMPLGKHRGPMRDVPTDYISWALSSRGMTDMSKDLKFTLQLELKERMGQLL